ncbi:MAG: DUF1194 domain-containing protein, partial [Bradyrhizobium sp.]|nr:DUF1194 domain-containing protein [Bradyrhizobium sp.]
MRWCVSIAAMLLLGAITGRDVAGLAAPGPQAQLATLPGTTAAYNQSAPSVDVELVLAVDVSYSIDMDELAIQRAGY